MDFRYELVSPDDQQWGSCDDRGNCTGIIGMLAREEADIGISSLTRTTSRAKYVDFSYSYVQDQVTFVTRKPDTRLINSVFFTKPFEPQVWISFACFLIFFVTMIKTLQRLNFLAPNMLEVKNITAILLRQGVSMKMATKECRGLIILIFLILSAACSEKIYESHLTSAISLAPTSRPLDKLEDMVDAIKNKGYSVGAPSGGSSFYQIMSSDSEYLKIFAKSMRKKDFKSYQNYTEALIWTLNQKYATIGPKAFLLKFALEAELDLSKFHFASEYIFLDQFAMAYGKNFQCKEALNKCLVLLAGLDLITKWEMKNQWKMGKATATKGTNEKYIDFNDFKLVLGGLIIGYALALFFLIIEVEHSLICKIKKESYKKVYTIY